MLRRLLLAVTAIAAVSFASTASAATKLGVGVLTNFQGSAGYVLIPMQVAPQLKVEPMVGINTNDQPTGGVDSSTISIGTGVFFTQKAVQQADVYFGGRLMLDFVSADDGVNDESGTNFQLAAAIGGEYYLVPKFSVGIEANLGFYSNADFVGDDSGFFTQGLAIIRFYL